MLMDRGRKDTVMRRAMLAFAVIAFASLIIFSSGKLTDQVEEAIIIPALWLATPLILMIAVGLAGVALDALSRLGKAGSRENAPERRPVRLSQA